MDINVFFYYLENKSELAGSKLTSQRSSTLYLDRAPDDQLYHSKVEMVENAKKALKDIKYDNKNNPNKGQSMFDDMEAFEGWNYIADKIFELPRNKEFTKVLEQRFTEAELIQRKKNRAKFKKRGLSFKKSNTNVGKLVP